MAINKIVKNSLGADSIDATKIADDAISEEHLDNSVIIGNTELSEAAASGDILLVYDTSAGALKKILASNVGTQAVTISAVSPTTVQTGDGTGNHTFVITGTNFTSANAALVSNTGTEVDFDSVTVNSATQITGVIAKSSLPDSGEPYDVRVFGANGLTANLRNQINVNAAPTFTTAAGSLGIQTIGTAGSFSVNATDPESAGNVTFELQSGSLPPSYSITNTAAEGGTAIISGTDNSTSTTTTFNFVLRAVDAASNTTSRAFSITQRALTSTSFTSSGTFAVPSGTTSGDVLVVAGGGGGGNDLGGGGGAGGLIFFPSYPLTPGGTITVTVGDGGAGGDSAQGSEGSNSAFGTPGDPGLSTAGVLTGVGGGGGSGGPTNRGGRAGGSGGGSGGHANYPSAGQSSHSAGSAQQATQPGNSGAYGFGNPGGLGHWPGNPSVFIGGGGGGAGAVGGNGNGNQAGGAGKAYTIADGTTSVYYAGGGGMMIYNSTAGSSSNGGQGGGGGENSGGQANKGGGGGGGHGASNPVADTLRGGKGIVIVRH